MPPTGVLLINTGTPDAPTVSAVRRFLREFLSDPYVVDINRVARSLLLNLVILPRRPRRSAAAYQKIWRAEGSPLLYYSNWFRDSLAAQLGESYRVALGMRYGNPSLKNALTELAACDHVILFPLFPHYAGATVGSALVRVEALLAAQEEPPHTHTVEPFYVDAGFVAALAKILQRSRRQAEYDHLLLSFHGLPQRQVIASEDKKVACDRVGSCPEIGPENERCYRAQCFATARALAETVGLAEGDYTVAFQSRLGAAKWIVPYTDKIIAELRGRGIERLLVMSPAFVADNLETLEELGLRLRYDWRQLGGTRFELAPSLNARADWVAAAADLVRNSHGG